MDGKICVVTGADSGIGKETVRQLCRRGARVVMICRSAERGEAARREIATADSGAGIEVLTADLSCRRAISELVARCADRLPRIDVLINNAAAISRRRQVSADGIEKTFAVNVLAPYILSTRLSERLRFAAPSRIVNVASALQRPLDFQDLHHEQRYSWPLAYSRSKHAQVLLTYELARRLHHTGVTVNCVHPGVIATNLLREFPPPVRGAFRLLARSPAYGALPVVRLAASAELEEVTGAYFHRSRRARSKRGTYDREAQLRLCEICESLARGWDDGRPAAEARAAAPPRASRGDAPAAAASAHGA